MTELSFSSDELSDLLDWASDTIRPDREGVNRAVDNVLFPGQHFNQQQPQQLGRLTNEELERHERWLARATVSRTALAFTRHFFAEIHDTLCVKKKLSEAVSIGGTDARSIATAIAAGLAASMGLSGPISISIATFVLLVISRAGLNAFCAATEDEILKEMSKADEALSQSRKRSLD
jgi:hypothetical protein